MADKRASETPVLREAVDGVIKLHLVGGLSLVFAGAAAVLLLIAPFSDHILASTGKASEWFYPATLIIAVIGALIAGLERYIEFRLAARRLEMMASITETLVQAATANQNAVIAPGDIRAIVDSVFDSVWRNSVVTRVGQIANAPEDTGSPS